MNNNENTNTTKPSADQADAREKTDERQALQINENTVEDPEPRSPDDFRDTDVHGRRDVPTRKQGLQINENTIDDPEPPSEADDHRS